MTSNPNYIAPQSASAPITTNLRKDELAALLTVEQGATAAQRIADTGNSIPLVFCKQSGANGGAWVTPPAVRYGLEENANDGNYFAFGLVVSDGQIPQIDENDVWKGPIRVNTLNEYGIDNAYGSLVETGYNYTLTSVDEDTQATSQTFTESSSTSDTDLSFPTFANSITREFQNVSTISYRLIVGNAEGGGNTNYFFGRTVVANSEFVANSGLSEATAYSESFSFDTPTTVTIRAFTQFANYWPRPAFMVFETIDIETITTTTVTTPFIPGSVTNLPLFPGSGGSFAGMSTLAVKGRYALEAESNVYRHQVRCFVRNGIIVDHVLGDSGSSSSFADLAYYLLKNASKVSENLIDLPSFQQAHRFTDRYSLHFNGVLANGVNLRDYLTRVAPLFCLRFVQINGKFALKPALPINADSYISLNPLTPHISFDDSNIVAGSFQKEYIDINQRKPFCALMTWRSQSESVYGTPKTNEVRYEGTAIDGPFEQYDMEEFCTTESHATLIGRYILASRKLTTHTISFQTTTLVGDLVPTDIIQVTWDYSASVATGGTSTIMYQVDSVSEGADGVFRIEATHFPTDANGVSQVAIDMLTGI